MRLLKSEIYRCLHQLSFLGMLAALVFVSILFFHSDRLGELDGGGILLLILSNPIPTLWVGVVLAGYCFALSFAEKTWNGVLFAGYGRRKTALTRMVVYYVCGVFIPLLSAVSVLCYHNVLGKVISLGITYLLPRMMIHLMLELAVLSVPLFLAFLLREVFRSIAVSAGFTVLLQYLFSYAGEVSWIRKLMRLHPAGWLVNMRLWTVFSMGEVFLCIILCLIYVVGGVVLSCVLFHVTELK